MSAVLDQFAKKVLTSGYSLVQTRRIALSGVRGWENKRLRRTQDGLRVFRTGKESLSSRIKKRTTGRTTWFRKKRITTAQDSQRVTPASQSGGSCKPRQPRGDVRRGLVTQGENKCQDGVKYKELQENLRTSTVLFVENTKGGELAERMRTTLKRIEEILGYRVKVVERSGTPCPP